MDISISKTKNENNEFEGNDDNQNNIDSQMNVTSSNIKIDIQNKSSSEDDENEENNENNENINNNDQVNHIQTMEMEVDGNNQQEEEAKENENHTENYYEPPLEIDPDYLAALPEDLREEVIAQHRHQLIVQQRRQRNRQSLRRMVDNNENNRNRSNQMEIDSRVLEEIPEDIFVDLLQNLLEMGNRESQSRTQVNDQIQGQGQGHGQNNSSSNVENLRIFSRSNNNINNNNNSNNNNTNHIQTEKKSVYKFKINFEKPAYGFNTIKDSKIMKGIVDESTISFIHTITPSSSLSYTQQGQLYENEMIYDEKEKEADIIIEHIFMFYFKYTCENSQMKLISNQYRQLIKTLLSCTCLRYKLIDNYFLLWMLDSHTLDRLRQGERNEKSGISKNKYIKLLGSALRYTHLYEEFFFEEFNEFINYISMTYPNEVKTFFLNTHISDDGNYFINDNGNKKLIKVSYNTSLLKKHLLQSQTMSVSQVNQGNENNLNVFIRLILDNCQSEIKKIYTIKMFQKIIKTCLKDKSDSLKITKKTIEVIIDLYYDFEASILINKEKTRTNNPSYLIHEMILDYKVFKIIISIINERIAVLNKDVISILDSYKNNSKSEIMSYIKPFPENVIFKMIKLLSKICKNLNLFNVNLSSNLGLGRIGTSNVSNLNSNLNSNTNNHLLNSTSKRKITTIEKIKQDMSDLVKALNHLLLEVYKKLDFLLSEINFHYKEDQKIVDPKLDRLIPFLEAFIIMCHLQFNLNYDLESERNLSSKEKFFKTNSKIEQTPQNDFFKNTVNDHFIDFFIKFCTNNKKIINLMLKRYPRMFPNDLLLKINKFLDLENKKKYLKSELKRLVQAERGTEIKITVHRNNLLSTSFDKLYKLTGPQMRNKLIIKFYNEEAVDAGGVKREWYSLLSKELFNPDILLFKSAANGVSYFPNENSGFGNENERYNHLELFNFAGKLVSKAIYDGFLLECYFTRGFYKLILNIPLTYHDMEDLDPDHYKNLKWLLENDISELDLGLNFSYVDEKFGKMDIIELVPNGENVDVTELNKFDYVQKISEAKLYTIIKPQVDSFLDGFYSIIPLNLISIFDFRELELLISGLPSIDVTDLKANTIYENYNEASQVVVWFWEILLTFDESERAEFLQFVTGSSKVPVQGFAYLQGIGGINKFKICKCHDKNYDRLPSAHTCTNQLDLPNYPSKEILNERLMKAIKEGKGFGFV